MKVVAKAMVVLVVQISLRHRGRFFVIDSSPNCARSSSDMRFVVIEGCCTWRTMKVGIGTQCELLSGVTRMGDRLTVGVFISRYPQPRKCESLQEFTFRICS